MIEIAIRILLQLFRLKSVSPAAVYQDKSGKRDYCSLIQIVVE